ncbi:MAG TPA: hypothetical protein VMM17_03425 [Gemmatimonadaceae bacterium]|nr:hypothetical protein [Gemmatimonadaceae bacterium]
MTTPAAPAPARRKWWLFLLALVAFVMFGYVPAGAAFTPVGPAFLLVGGAAIACVLVAAALHGRTAVVPLAVAVAGILLTATMPATEQAYRYLVIGWTVVLSASFGLVSLLTPAQPFLPRALATLAIALVVSIAGVALFGDGLEKVRSAMYAEAARRADIIDMAGQRQFSAAGWRDAEVRQPQLAAVRAAYEEWVHALPQRTIFLLPSLLALQSLAGLALGWELFHRLSRQRIGAPLARLRDFSFNDQYIWAVAVGLTILLLPEFADGRAAGANILLFFGALFALRGFGVLASFRHGRLLVPLVALLFLVAWPLAATVTLLLGLADIWLDVRRRARPAH